MAYAHKPISLGGRDQEVSNLWVLVRELGVPKTPISINSWAQWSTPGIPAMQETEIRRITVLGQPGEKKLAKPPS
jgi:hypothetical protein